MYARNQFTQTLEPFVRRHMSGVILQDRKPVKVRGSAGVR
jgi:hypothetical protein